VADAFFSYTPVSGAGGFGDVTYTFVPVPEPPAALGSLAFSLLLARVYRRR
jgi:hypothetical protein